MSDNKPEKKGPNKWLALIGIPFQMGVIIFLFSWFGSWLDDSTHNTSKLYFTIFTMLGVALALYNVIRQVNQINK
jgi:F0F1-type ATP synthase assembly protein I